MKKNPGFELDLEPLVICTTVASQLKPDIRPQLLRLESQTHLSTRNIGSPPFRRYYENLRELSSDHTACGWAVSIPAVRQLHILYLSRHAY